MPLSKTHLTRFLDYLRAEKNYSPHTLLAYHKDLERFQGFFRNLNLSAAGFEQDFGDNFRLLLQGLRSKNISSRSIARLHSALKSYFRFLFRTGLAKSDWSMRLSRVKYGRTLPEVPAQERIREMLERIRTDTPDGARDRAILELFYSSGLRLAELAGLRLPDIDMHAGMLRVIGKGRKERIVPVGSMALSCLNNYLDQRSKLPRNSKGDTLFLNRLGGQLSRRSIAAVVRKYSGLDGRYKPFSPHKFRHACATHLLDQGADLTSVQKLLGHASLASTQIYTSVSLEKLKKVYKKTHPRA